MPLSSAHKQKTRAHIVETARKLFNQKGFEGVSIDTIMEAAGLTRGGFYNHFKNKEELYAEAVRSFLRGRGAEWRNAAGIDMQNLDPKMAEQMIEAYLSDEHLGDLEGQCPMIALPSDIARAGDKVGGSYQILLEAMVGLFEDSLSKMRDNPRQEALKLAALCIGGMTIARALPNSDMADDIRRAAQACALEIVTLQGESVG